jgi:uncharacterized protein (DUF779 family)
MRLLHAILLTSIISCSAFGQTYTISTFAGGALPVNIPGTSASLGSAGCVAADRAGNVFFVVQNTVLRMDAITGVLTLVAGNQTTGFSGDSGPATSAELYYPQGLAVDFAGNLYIADTYNARIRKVSGGVITTVAGNGTLGFSGDNGPATSAQLSYPQDLAVDSAGNLYIADLGNARIRKVSGGVITTVAGNGTTGFSGDNGPATSAQLDGAYYVAVDSAGNLYIADCENNRIRKVANGVITTVAGGGTSGLGDNGPATSAQLSIPQGLAVDSAGNLYIVDSDSCRIRKVSGGVITTVAGDGWGGFGGDNGPATSAQLFLPSGVAVDSAGNLYIVDSDNYRIRKVSGGVITTVAGNGTGFGGDNGPATSAQLFLPSGVAVDSVGNLYIADAFNARIRKVSNSVITTFAGNGTVGFSGDNGPASSAQLNGPASVAVDSTGSLYIADAGNSRIRKVSGGVITTVAGNGGGFSGDNGPATGAEFNNPCGVAVDSAGNLYIADYGNRRIRMVSNGVIATVAGNGTPGLSGDNGPATSAQLSGPTSIAVDSTGSLYIGDAGNSRVRKVSGGVITTVAGNGNGFGGDNGLATNAQFNDPHGVAVDSAGNLYIADIYNNRIRKVSNGVITTIAGNGTGGFSGDNGPATNAQLNYPTGVAVDPAGNLYIADIYNNRIRVLTPTDSSCTYSVSPTSFQAPASGGNLTVNIQTTASCSWVVSGMPSWITVSGAFSGTGSATVTLVVAPNSGAAQSATVLVAGASVTVTQQPATSPCIYAISPGGQALAAAGGNGTINITAGAGCAWTASSTASWVAITGVGTGSGNGNVTFQAAPNTGAARSGSVSVAGLSFTVEEAAASSAGLIGAGSMAQLASGGYWTTTITLVNTGSSPAQARLSFFDNNGNPLALPLSFPPPSGGAIPLVLLLASTLDRTLNPGAELVIQSAGPNNQATLVGWAQLLTNGTIGGFAVFSQAIGNANQEAVVPLENRNAGGYVVPFDNTNGSATGIALANISPQAVNSAITVRDDTGAVIVSDTIALPAMGHTSFNLTDRYASMTAQRRGTLEFQTPSAGQISVLGLRFNSTGAFSTIPALAK